MPEIGLNTFLKPVVQVWSPRERGCVFITTRTRVHVHQLCEGKLYDLKGGITQGPVVKIRLLVPFDASYMYVHKMKYIYLFLKVVRILQVKC